MWCRIHQYLYINQQLQPVKIGTVGKNAEKQKRKHKMIQAGCKEGNKERTRMSADSVDQEV
jgi:hypothetical protein